MASDPIAMLLEGGGADDKSAASPEEDAAKDALAAIKANDAKALCLALTRHYEALAGKEDAEGDDEMDEDESKEV